MSEPSGICTWSYILHCATTPISIACFQNCAQTRACSSITLNCTSLVPNPEGTIAMDTSPSQLLRSVADEVRKGRLQRRRGRERAQGGNDRTIDSDAEQTEARLQHDRESQGEEFC